ncbi:hypothetical protein PVOR_19114 [Paenibacillus vortex V453]|uniref:Uncharacterized protein n=1 Tax=Paenibacillus vortex V453 TaxID=715225 RepID=A0A2R9ST47_9BACL|nr:hypothetical protein PVOR_19114 [Paenibacillus vortex V453]
MLRITNTLLKRRISWLRYGDQKKNNKTLIALVSTAAVVIVGGYIYLFIYYEKYEKKKVKNAGWFLTNPFSHFRS